MADENKSNTGLKMTMSVFDKKLDFLTKNALISLIVVGIIGLSVRLFYFPYNVPLTSDALSAYFFYATDTSILGHLPSNFAIANNGWPIFLSFFFSIFRFDNALDYMALQREITISLSILTIIPVYFLCRRFFDKPYALVGAAIFAFEPRIIQNSLLGITEPLYIIMVASALVLFFSSNRKMTYASFGIIALATLVRSEGLFVFIPLLVMFFIRERKEKAVAKTLLAACIFVLLLLPIAIFRIQVQGNDTITGRILYSANQILTSPHEGGLFNYVVLSFENFVKLTGWSTIPIFIFFLPFGIFFILKNQNYHNMTLIVVIISMMLPVFYGFSFNQDTRYIYPLFPLFCVLSIFTVKSVVEKVKARNTFLILIIIGILLASGVFLDFKKFDYEHQKEAFSIAHQVITTTKGINDYYPEDTYIKPAEISSKWPVLSSDIPSLISIIPTQGFDSPEKYIESSKNKGLTHLVVDGAKNRSPFVNEVFYHEEKYPYLIKVYDSWDYDYKYHVKIYKIDYKKLESP